MIKKMWVGGLFFGLILNGLAQENTSSQNWKVLSGVEYDKSRDEYGEIYIPKFGPEIQALEGKEIELSGYIIPFEGMFEPDKLIISSQPVASCFFCGGAGPESVAQVLMENPVKYTAKKVTIRGTLGLNNKNIDQLMYVLKNAKLISE